MPSREMGKVKQERLCMGCMKEKTENARCPYCGYVEGTAPAAPFFLPPNTVLNGRYIIGRVLGHGGFGITYLAWDKLEDKKTAIKEYFPEGIVARMPGFPTVSVYSGAKGDFFRTGLEKFLDEAKALRPFREHPGVVSVYDFFHANNTAYMVMEYLEGQTLSEHLAKYGGKIGLRPAMELLASIFDALEEVHATGMLHRDIKPDNILVVNGGKQTVLIDFGAARQFVGQRSRNLSALVTDGYSPFEQYQEDGEQGVWTDVYALGATLYRVFSGERPPQSTSRIVQDKLVPLTAKVDGMPKKAALAVNKAMAINPKDRFQSMADFRRALLAAEEVVVYCPQCGLANTLSEGQSVKNTVCNGCQGSLVKPSAIAVALQKGAAQMAAATRWLAGNSKKLALAAVAIVLVGLVAWGASSVKGTGKLTLGDGGSYDGEYWLGKPSGQGTLVYSDGRKFTGAFKDGVFVNGTIITKDGMKYEGQYANGKYTGRGTLAVKDSFSYVGNFKEGKYEGTGELLNVAKRLRYSGQFKGGLKEGQGKLADEKTNTVVYDGAWQGDKRSGAGSSQEAYPASGGVIKYKGEWREDKKNGQGTAVVFDGGGNELFRYQGIFKNDKMEDENGQVWFPNGDHYSGGISDDKFNGRGTFTWKSGRSETAYWKDDVKVR